MIEINHLTVRYPGSERDALNDVSLNLPDVGFIALMGANGSGKSTLARTLACLLAPASGTVLVDGLDTGDSAPGIRSRLGIVFQDPAWQMTSLSVTRELAFGLENMGVEPGVMRRKVAENLARFGLEARAESPPWELSAGEQQRLALASVLIMEPAYLVLDEATSLLSPPSRRHVMEMVAKERGRRLVLLITQFPDEALAAERLVVLDRGTIVADGPPHGVFRETDKLTTMGVAVPLETLLGSRG